MEGFLWPLVVFHAIVGIVGIPGNVLVILVYARKRQIISPHVFIVALALADLTVCLFSPVTVYHWVIRLSYSSDFLCRLVVTVTFVTVYNSSFVTSAIAIDRYQAICTPFRRWMTIRRAKITALMCLIIAVIIGVPVFASYGVERAHGAETGVCSTSKDAASWIAVMYTIIYTSSLATLVINIVLYGKMYSTIRRQAAVVPGQVSQNEAKNSMTSLSRDLCLRGLAHQNPVSAVDNPAPGSGLTVEEFASSSRKLVDQSSFSEFTSSNNHPGGIPDQTRSTPKQLQGLASPKISGNRTDISNSSTNGTSSRVQAGTDAPTGHGRKPVPAPKFQRSTTKMLVVTTVVFFSTWVLGLCLLSTIPIIQKSLRDERGVVSALMYFLGYIFYINNAINPFIYGFMNRRFREDCKKTLSALHCRRCC